MENYSLRCINTDTFLSTQKAGNKVGVVSFQALMVTFLLIRGGKK